MLQDDISHDGKMDIQHFHDLFRRRSLGHGREATDIGKQNGELDLLSCARLQIFFVIVQHFVQNVLGNVLGEQLRHAALFDGLGKGKIAERQKAGRYHGKEERHQLDLHVRLKRKQRIADIEESRSTGNAAWMINRLENITAHDERILRAGRKRTSTGCRAVS